MDQRDSSLTDQDLRRIIHDLGEAIQIWRGDGRLAYANAASAALFGMDCPLPAGAGYTNFDCNCFQPDGAPLRYDDLPFVRVLRNGEPVSNELLRTRGPDGAEHWVRISCRPLGPVSQTDEPAVIVSAVDVTELIEQQQRLQQMAHYDLLTRLPNRALFADRIRQALGASTRAGDLVAICLMDLDGFKPINDQYGHKAGDQVLREVAQRLTESVRGGDTVARLGGDEFALLLCRLKSWSECEFALRRIVDALNRPYAIGGDTMAVSASIGVTLFPDDAGDQDLLVRHADLAMYKAKEGGKNRYVLFDSGPELRAQANQGLLTRIERGIAEEQFRLYYQPKVDCRWGRVVGAEALLRWQHPVLGLLAPNEFLPLIEHDDLIVQLGEWVLEQGLAQTADWLARGLDLGVSVNIATRQLHRRDFIEHLRATAARYPDEVLRHFEIEIVETAALDDVNTVSDFIRECGKLGVRVALDDFGTGFSSLTHLKRLSADVLKIDQTFVKGMLDDPGDLAIVDGVIGLASAFKRQVIAEGVESIDHILMLLELGCNVMQGYSLAHPMQPERLPQWIAAFQPDPLWNLAASPRPNRDYFELLLAESNHRTWIDRMLAQARTWAVPDAVRAQLDPGECRFGRWYRSDGLSRFGRMTSFRRIDEVHSAVHRHALQMYKAGMAGDVANGKRAEESMVAASTELIDLLRGLRKSLANEMLGNGNTPAVAH